MINNVTFLVIAYISIISLTSCGPNKVSSKYFSTQEYYYVDREGDLLMTSKPNKAGENIFKINGNKIEQVGIVYFDINGEVIISGITNPIINVDSTKVVVDLNDRKIILNRKIHNEGIISYDAYKRKDSPVFKIDYGDKNNGYITVYYGSIPALSNPLSFSFKPKMVRKEVIDKNKKIITSYRIREGEISRHGVSRPIYQQRLKE